MRIFLRKCRAKDFGLTWGIDRGGIFPVGARNFEQVADEIVFPARLEKQAAAGDVYGFNDVFEKVLTPKAATDADGDFDLNANAVATVSRVEGGGVGERKYIDRARTDFDRGVTG
jgi:hypothetical protein